MLTLLGTKIIDLEHFSERILWFSHQSLDMQSFPFDCGNGLRRDVVEHAVHALDLVDDAVRDVLQKLERDILDRSGHCIGRVDGADDNRPIPAALSVDDTGGLVVGYDGEVLPYLAGKAVLCKLLAQDRI